MVAPLLVELLEPLPYKLVEVNKGFKNLIMRVGLQIVGTVFYERSTEEVADVHISVFKEFATPSITDQIVSIGMSHFNDIGVKTLIATVADSNRVAQIFVRRNGFIPTCKVTIEGEAATIFVGSPDLYWAKITNHHMPRNRKAPTAVVADEA